MIRVLREPLVHFLALGALLFLLFAFVGDSSDGSKERITVTRAKVDQLAELWSQTWQREPTEEELEGIIEEHVREEIAYREAVAMGLDRDDTIIRRRMRQKVEFLTEDPAAEPADEELRRYFDENLDDFRQPRRISFEHVVIEGGRADELLRLLNEGRADPFTVGEPTLLPPALEDAYDDEVARRFGRRFAAAIAPLPVGSWAGPVESEHGVHLVRVSDREMVDEPSFERMRRVVRREWEAERRAEARDAFYDGLRERYEVVVERE